MSALNDVVVISSMPPASFDTMPLDKIMYTVLSERASVSETVVREIAYGIQSNNKEISSLNEIKQIALASKNEGKLSFKVPEDVSAEAKHQLQNLLGDDYDTYFEPDTLSFVGGGSTLNLTFRSEMFSGDKADGSYEYVNTLVDNKISELNSLGQMSMIDLQSGMDKYNGAFDALTNFLSKYNQSLSTVSSNMR